MRYPTNLENIVRLATLTATNCVASSAWELVSRDADGGGSVELSGSYTGADDATVDVEVTSLTINGAPQISAPIFSGVGNGLLVGISADSGIDAQEFTVTVLDTGTPTRKAWAPFQSVSLRAILAGSAGNDLSVRVSQSGLTATATDYATTEEMSAGASEFSGDQYNFGAVLLEPEGTVPANATRLRFGDDVTVYRHFRTFRDGAYRYHVSPPLRRDVPIGTRVYVITNGRTVEVLDGATVSETYTGVTTLYSLLSQIAASSALIEVDGVIAQDRRPGGMACDDLSVHTASYSAGSARDGTSFIKRAVVPLTVPTAAPTESLTVTCSAAPIPGAEIWQAIGTVSGDLGTFITGEAFSDAGYALTIPIELQPGAAPAGDRSAFLELGSRGEGAQIPSLCVRNFLLGAEAQTRTYTFEWRPHPGEECDCRSEPISGGPNNDFLGIDDGGVAVATLPAAVKTLYQDIQTWRKGALALNCYFTNTDDDTQLTNYYSGLRIVDSAELLADGEATAPNFPPAGILNGVFQKISVIAKFDEQDIRAITMVADLFQTHLLAIYTEMGGTGALDSAVETAFQTEWDYIVDALTPLMYVSNNGSTSWKTGVYQAFIHSGYAAGSAVGDPDLLQVYLSQAVAGAKNLTQNLEPLLRRCQASIANVYIAGDLLSPFDAAGLTGNAVWQDHRGTHWFASQDGLLPIQPGWYYHSARLEHDDELDDDVPTATREFGIGVAIGCPELLQVGDKLIITTTPFANGRATYQAGDVISWQIIRADPVALGGGQTGDDTITFGVRGSVVGALADYPLVTTSLSSYSNGGLSLTIVPGAIDFLPGDRWTFAAEGGEARYRIDGGSWTTFDIAGTVALASGISAEFVAGATPSWEVGDTYQFTMLASSGVGRARAPDDESMSWTGSTLINITPAGSGEADTLLIASHTIPSTATVTLTGSNDNWSTVAFTQVVSWASGSMAALFDATTCAKWRLAIDDTGSIDWLYLGVPERPIVQGTTSTVEYGTWRRRARLANGQRNRSLGGIVTHESCTQASVDALLTAIEHAHTNDDGRIGAISPEGEATLCTVADEIDIDDATGFQPAAASRRIGFALILTPR
jgi:hypothetical protein